MANDAHALAAEPGWVGTCEGCDWTCGPGTRGWVLGEATLHHKEGKHNTLVTDYLDGVGDHGPGGDDPVGPTESKPHRPPSGSPQSDGSA